MSASDEAEVPGRTAPRVPIEGTAELEFESFQGFLNEYSSNISAGGMFVRTAEPPPVGTVLRLKLKLKGNFKLIQGRGQVVWVRTEDAGRDRPPGMGVRFLELEGNSADLIQRMVERYRSHGGAPFDLEDSGILPEATPPPALTVPSQGEVAQAIEDAKGPERAIFVPPGPAAAPPSPPRPAAAAAKPAAGPSRPATAAARPPRQAPGRRRAISPATVVLVLLSAAAGAALSRYGEPLVQWVTGAEPASAERVVLDVPPPEALASQASRPTRRQQAPAGEPDAEPVATAQAEPPRPVAASPPATAPAADEPAGTAVAVAADGPRLTRVKLITVKDQPGGGTLVTLRGDGYLEEASFTHLRLGESSTRELVKLKGVDWPFRDPVVEVGTSEIRRIRTGFHPKPTGNELHIVIDLVDAQVQLASVNRDERNVELFFRR